MPRYGGCRTSVGLVLGSECSTINFVATKFEHSRGAVGEDIVAAAADRGDIVRAKSVCASAHMSPCC